MRIEQCQNKLKTKITKTTYPSTVIVQEVEILELDFVYSLEA